MGKFDFFIVPHHTTRAGKYGEISDDIYPGEKLMPVIEIHSRWGCSEHRGNEFPLARVHDGPAYARDFLKRGMRLGFIGGTDTHTTMTFCAPELEPEHIRNMSGLTAVYGGSLTRNNIFRSIAARNCYAASGERVLLHLDAEGIRMGEVSEGKHPKEIRVMAAAESAVSSVDLISNGEIVQTTNINDWKADVKFKGGDITTRKNPESGSSGDFVYYYVRVNCSSGAKAWSSPVWFKI